MLGQIAGAVIGGIMSNKAAKKQSAAMDRATQAQMQGYLDAQPYIKRMYEGGEGALNDALAKGYYGGPTYASLNDDQRAALDNQLGLSNTGFADSSGFMDAGRGFAGNYQDLYNRAGTNMLDTAVDYAANNSEPLLQAAMRDSYRNLTENTLPGIARGASSTGNTNSSRAGVAEAIAQRAYDDRSADTAANIQDRLINRSMTEQQNRLSNMTNANRNLATTYGTGFDLGNSATRLGLGAGGAYQTDQQNQYNDARANFEGERDFALDQYNRYNAGILGRAPQTAGQVNPNLVDPTMAGLSGAGAGFGIGGDFMNMFKGFGGGGYGTTGATNMSRILPYTDNMGFGVG